MFASIRSKIILAAAALVVASQPVVAAEVRIKLGQSKTVIVIAPDGSKVKVRLEFSGDNTGVMLEVKHSGKGMLTYKARMCFKGTDRCVPTSTVEVMPKIQSTELWADPIDRLILSEFSFAQ